MTSLTVAADPIESLGFAVVESAIDGGDLNELLDYFDVEADGAHGVRNLLARPRIAQLARSPEIRALVEPVLGREAFAVRGIFFDKVPEANWKVPWHQDVTITVRERHDLPGFHPWSVKNGLIHVQPPREVLERMLTVRLHLDDCGPQNGPLRAIPSTHAMGKLLGADVDRLAGGEGMALTVAAGGAVLMRPLLLHCSSPSQSPTHRRVVHLEFASCELPPPLQWSERAKP